MCSRCLLRTPVARLKFWSRSDGLLFDSHFPWLAVWYYLDFRGGRHHGFNRAAALILVRRGNSIQDGYYTRIYWPKYTYVGLGRRLPATDVRQCGVRISVILNFEMIIFRGAALQLRSGRKQ